MGLPQSIVIVSGKGGSGKSTVAINLGRCIAALGKRVVLLDMDMGMRSLDLMLGLQDKVVYDIADVAEGICRLKQALIRIEQNQEFYLLNAAQTRGSDAITPQQVEQIVRKLKERFDYVLLDCPAGVDRGFKNACAGAETAILVITPDQISLRDAERVVGLLQKCGIRNTRLLVNRVGMDVLGLTIEDCEQRLRLPLIGWLPEIGAAEGIKLTAFDAISRRLIGEEIPLEMPRSVSYINRVLRVIRGQ